MKPGLRLAIVLTLAATTLATPASTQGPRLSAVMREKLDHAKNILGAVVTSDWGALDRESRALARAAHDPAWVALTAPEYLRQSDAFSRALQGLIEASATRDLEAAAKADVALTTSCVGCHQAVTR